MNHDSTQGLEDWDLGLPCKPAAHTAQASTEDELSDHERERKARPMRGVEPLERRLLDIREVSEYTGLSVHTLYTMVSQRRIPFVKVGRLVKFDVDLLDKWIEQNTVMPMPTKHG